ncbi:hypothetical protein [[Mycoplasma] gypis]|uniref:S1 motif domain-containing protein n=1 Tax=[Mycoplasma] gypis TaxID=92404 RepID=A0ABZ2RNY4_9BACT|nr:hypothetical protein [[Mycoplasma] gypis]MBN0919610.1 hypothetical protein [[Mycoplasma] gypis]
MSKLERTFMHIFSSGEIIECKVVRIYRSFILCETKRRQICKLNLKDVSDFYIQDLNDIFCVGDFIDVQVLNYDVEKKTYIVSFKNIHPRYLRNPFEFKFQSDAKSFEKLLSFCTGELKNERKN